MSFPAWSLVALGGGLGATTRWLMAGWLEKGMGLTSQWSIACVNLIGCSAIGFLWATLEKQVAGEAARLFLATGFLGGLTTFSTYSLDLLKGIKASRFDSTIMLALVSNVGGLVMAWLGYWLANRFAFRT